MRFQQTPRFRSDRADLSTEHFGLFWTTVRDSFIPAAERRVAEPGTPWPGGLPVKSVKGAPGVWEMTWSFSGPDGRATFEWVEIESEAAIRWRRVGSHSIFSEP